MKKVIALSMVLFGVCMVAHAISNQNTAPQQAPSATQDSTTSNDTNNNDQQSGSPHAEEVGTGSGDDADTSYDKDPEADDSAG